MTRRPHPWRTAALIALLVASACSSPVEMADLGEPVVTQVPVSTAPPENPTAAPVADPVADLATCDEFGRWTASTDVIIFLNHDASGEEIAAVESDLEAIAGIASLSFTDQDEAFRQFQDASPGSRQLQDSVEAQDMPTSFAIQFQEPRSDHAAAFTSRFRLDDRVFDIVERPTTCPPTDEEVQAACALGPQTSIVFLNPDASPSEVDAVAARLSANAAITTVTFIDKEAAFAQFQEMYVEEDAIRDAVAVVDMPPNFELTSEAGALTDFLDALRSAPGIFEIIDDGC